MDTKELHYLELIEVGQRIQARAVSSVEVTRGLLERIGKLDGALRSYALVMAAQAMDDARRADEEIVAETIRGLCMACHWASFGDPDRQHLFGLSEAAAQLCPWNTHHDRGLRPNVVHEGARTVVQHDVPWPYHYPRDRSFASPLNRNASSQAAARR